MIGIHVDRERCQRYAQCVMETPDMFQLDSDGELAYHAAAEDDRLDDVQAAADVCPMQAITIRTTDDRAGGGT